LTPLWKGERFPYGRPKVPDLVIENLKHATLEHIWTYLERRSCKNQVENNLAILKPGETMTGKVVTTQFMRHYLTWLVWSEPMEKLKEDLKREDKHLTY
tara:strand:- start:3337 stop:3633 length:297 start_codon:yes stop_codon:yes gene_type:complete